MRCANVYSSCVLFAPFCITCNFAHSSFFPSIFPLSQSPFHNFPPNEISGYLLPPLMGGGVFPTIYNPAFYPNPLFMENIPFSETLASFAELTAPRVYIRILLP
jgi:hypothetical protein